MLLPLARKRKPVLEKDKQQRNSDPENSFDEGETEEHDDDEMHPVVNRCIQLNFTSHHPLVWR